MTRKTSKTRTTKSKAEPMKLKISLDCVAIHPPPTSIDECPRCEKEHKKLKPLKFKRPMQFFRAGADGKPVMTSQASHWAQCPKTKEPIIFFDRVNVGESIENAVMRQAVDDICKEEDAKFLSEITSAVGKTKTTTRAVWAKAPGSESTVSVKTELGDVQTWVYDPKAARKGSKTTRKVKGGRKR